MALGGLKWQYIVSYHILVIIIIIIATTHRRLKARQRWWARTQRALLLALCGIFFFCFTTASLQLWYEYFACNTSK